MMQAERYIADQRGMSIAIGDLVRFTKHHSHAGCTARFLGMESVGWKEAALFELVECKHGVDRCFAFGSGRFWL